MEAYCQHHILTHQHLVAETCAAFFPFIDYTVPLQLKLLFWFNSPALRRYATTLHIDIVCVLVCRLEWFFSFSDTFNKQGVSLSVLLHDFCLRHKNSGWSLRCWLKTLFIFQPKQHVVIASGAFQHLAQSGNKPHSALKLHLHLIYPWRDSDLHK